MGVYRAYLSHSIRGRKGKAATNKDMEKNCQIAIEVAAEIREAIPGLDLYVPAEHDEFVALAYHKGYLTETQLLEIDCMILGKRDFLLIYAKDGYISRGMNVEYQFAISYNIPIFKFEYWHKQTAIELRAFIEELKCKNKKNVRNAKVKM